MKQKNKSNKGKTIVFGGSGFLGSFVVKELSKRNYDVLVADINHSKYIEKYDFIKCDILDNIEVSNIIEKTSPDIVLNFAGYANLDSAINHPIECINLNVIGNLNIIEACRVKGSIKRFIYASSSYAMNNKASFYGLSKLTSEKIIEEYGKQYNLKFSIIRFGSVYSQYNYDNNYIYQLVKSAIKNKKIIHPGDGEEVREYIHSEDAAKLMVEVMENPEYIGQHIILTGFEKIKRKELFVMIKEILNEDIEISLEENGYNHHYQQTPYQFQATLSKKLIANPYIDLGQGILQCIQNIKYSDEI